MAFRKGGGGKVTFIICFRKRVSRKRVGGGTFPQKRGVSNLERKYVLLFTENIIKGHLEMILLLINLRI